MYLFHCRRELFWAKLMNIFAIPLDHTNIQIFLKQIQQLIRGINKIWIFGINSFRRILFWHKLFVFIVTYDRIFFNNKTLILSHFQRVIKLIYIIIFELNFNR